MFRDGQSVGRAAPIGLALVRGAATRRNLLLLATILSALVVACARPGAAAPSVESSAANEDGKRLFSAHCASCHGEKGDRLAVAPLNSKEFLDTRGDATLLAVIGEGKGVMPAFGKTRGGPLSDQELRTLVAYISTVAGRSSSSGLAEIGKQLFANSCATCHGEKGDRIPIAPLSVKGFLDNRTNSELVRVIEEGKGVMPAFGKGSNKQLTSEQIKAIVAYLRFTVDANVAASARLGRDLYMANCLSCHGERGERVTGVEIASPEYLNKLGDGGLVAAINEGKGAMPGFGRAKGGSFAVTDTTALLAYIKSWAGLNATSALAGAGVSGEGKDLFIKNCTPCHGDGGDKVAGVRLKSADFLQSRTDAVLLQTIADGNAKGMPAWGKSNGGPFSDAQIKSILDYLKSTASSAPSEKAAAPAQKTDTPAQPTASSASADVAALAAKGKEVFTKNCVACHGETRDKIPTCKLADKDWVGQKGLQGLTNSITNGKGPMPAWGKAKGGSLSEDDINAVATYLMKEVGLTPGSPTSESTKSASGADRAQVPLAPPPPADAKITPTVEAGKELFTKNCVMCHGEDGLRQKNCPLGSRAWLINNSEEGLRARITGGKPSAGMPAWGASKGGPLSDDQITAIMLYLNVLAK